MLGFAALSPTYKIVLDCVPYVGLSPVGWAESRRLG